MPQPTKDTDEVEDILDRQSPNIGSYYGEEDFYAQQPKPVVAPSAFVPQQAPVAPQPVPIEQAQAAVEAALQLQARRGYQRDLESGTPAPEALAKWAPIMFAAPRNTPATVPGVPRGSSGMPLPGPLPAFQAVKSAQPPVEQVLAPSAFVPPKPQELQMGGVLYRRTPQGDLVEVPGQRQRVIRAPSDPYGPIAYREKLAHVAQLQKAIDEDPTGQHEDDKRIIQQELKDAEAIRSGVRTSAATSTKRVRVRNKAGKTGTIPADQLDAALAEGYTRVQ